MRRNENVRRLDTTLFYRWNQLHVSANGGSHHQGDHKNENMKCLQLYWWLETSKFTNVLLYCITYVTCKTCSSRNNHLWSS